MCRNIKTLYNFSPPATEDEIRASALQFVRKISGYSRPSQANEAAFHLAGVPADHAGMLTPDTGTVRFAGEDITALPPYSRSLLGLARSFQITSLFLDLSAGMDHVQLGAYIHDLVEDHELLAEGELLDVVQAAFDLFGSR